MIQRMLVRDVFDTFAYFYIDEQTKHGFLIDPGANAAQILAVIAQNGWTIEKILLTHGHFDHTGAVEEVSTALGVPYLIHQNGAEYLMNTELNLSAYCQRHVVLRQAQYVAEGEVIALEANPNFSLKVEHTPGHTPDSVVFYNEKDGVAFVGDTIFCGNVGSTQYPGGNRAQLNSSIARIFQMPEDVQLLSGHSEPTTVGMEKNRYMNF